MVRIRKNFVASRSAAEVQIAELMAARLPLRITDAFALFPGARKLNHQVLLRKLSGFDLVAARLASGTLDLAAPKTFDIRTYTGEQILQDKSLWHDFYFSEPLTELPAEVGGLMPYPFRCNEYTWFKGRLWLAGDKSRTPLHRDIPHNLLFVTQGEKDVMLVRPGDSRKVYSNRLFSKAPNFAQVDVRRPDMQKFPRLADLEVVRVRVAAGEILYIPPFWWHDIINVGKVTSINFWFAPVGRYSLLAAIAALFASISGLYRNAWHKAG